MSESITHVIAGPPEHGVTRYAGFLLRELETMPGPSGRAFRHRRLDPGADGAHGGLVHLSFTDRLFGPDPDTAVSAVRELARGKSLSINLHDVPQEDEGTQRFERRRRAYSELLDIATVVVVNSDHEALQTRRYLAGDRDRVEVVPLPLEPPAGSQVGPRSARSPRNAPPVIGLMGFIHPGKGYERVIRSAPEGARIRAIGTVAAGHDDYVRQLGAAAAQRGLVLEVTGFVPDSRLAAELARVTVPVCPHLHVSASGSLNTWIAHGRRPIALEGPYMREVARRWPGSIHLCTPAALSERLVRGARDPAYTRNCEPLPRWGWTEVASAYTRIWHEARG